MRFWVIVCNFNEIIFFAKEMSSCVIDVFIAQVADQTADNNTLSSTADMDIIVEDTDLLSGLLDCVVILWMGIQPSLNKVWFAYQFEFLKWLLAFNWTSFPFAVSSTFFAVTIVLNLDLYCIVMCILFVGFISYITWWVPERVRWLQYCKPNDSCSPWVWLFELFVHRSDVLYHNQAQSAISLTTTLFCLLSRNLRCVEHSSSCYTLRFV